MSERDEEKAVVKKKEQQVTSHARTGINEYLSQTLGRLRGIFGGNILFKKILEKLSQKASGLATDIDKKLDKNILAVLMPISMPAVDDVNRSKLYTLLSAYISNECIKALKSCQDILSSSFTTKNLEKFVKELLRLLIKYQRIISDILSNKLVETDKYKSQLIRCLEEIQKKCRNDEVLKLTKKNFDKELAKLAKLVNWEKEDMPIGDFAVWLGSVAKNTEEEIDKKKFQTRKELLEFIFGQNEKNNPEEQIDEFYKTLKLNEKFHLYGLRQDVTLVDLRKTDVDMSRELMNLYRDLEVYMRKIIEAKKHAFESYEEAIKLVSNAERAAQVPKIDKNDLDRQRVLITLKYEVFRKFRVSSKKPYELIDKDDNITDQIYNLDDITLKKLLRACPEILESIKKSSDEMDKLIDEKEGKAAEIAVECFNTVQSIFEKEARFSDEYRLDKKTYDVSKYPGLNNLFEEYKKYNEEFLKRLTEIFTLKNGENNYVVEDEESIYLLNISGLNEFIENINKGLPALKDTLSKLEDTLKKVDNLIDRRSKDHYKKCKELEALLDEIAKMRNAVDNDFGINKKYFTMPLDAKVGGVYSGLLGAFSSLDYDEDEESGYLSRKPSGGYVVLKDRIYKFSFDELESELESVSAQYKKINSNYKQWQDFMASQKKAYDEETSEAKKKLQEIIDIYNDLHAKLKKHGLKVRDSDGAQSIETIVEGLLNNKYLNSASRGKLSVNDAKLSDLKIDQLTSADEDITRDLGQIKQSQGVFDAFVTDKVEKGKEPAKRKVLKKEIENVLSVFRSAEKSMGRFIRKFKKKYPKGYEKHIFGEPVEKFDGKDGILDIYKDKFVSKLNALISKDNNTAVDADVGNIVSHDYTYHTIDYDEIKTLPYPELDRYIGICEDVNKKMQKAKEDFDNSLEGPAKRKVLKKKIEDVIGVLDSAAGKMEKLIEKMIAQNPASDASFHINKTLRDAFENLFFFYDKRKNETFSSSQVGFKRDYAQNGNVLDAFSDYRSIVWAEDRVIDGLGWKELDQSIGEWDSIYKKMQERKKEFDKAIKNYKDEYQEKYDELEKTLKEIIGIESRIQKDAKNLAVPDFNRSSIVLSEEDQKDDPRHDFYTFINGIADNKNYLIYKAKEDPSYVVNYEKISELNYEEMSEAVSFSKGQLGEISRCKTSWDAYFKKCKENYKKNYAELKKKLSEIISDYENIKKSVRELSFDNGSGAEDPSIAAKNDIMDKLVEKSYLITKKDSYKINSKYISGLRGDKVQEAVSKVKDLQSKLSKLGRVIINTDDDDYGVPVSKDGEERKMHGREYGDDDDSELVDLDDEELPESGEEDDDDGWVSLSDPDN